MLDTWPRMGSLPPLGRGASNGSPAVRGAPNGSPVFDVQAFLDSAGIAKNVVEYRRGETIFRQGDACDDCCTSSRAA